MVGKATDSGLGGRVGAKVAAYLAQAHVSTKQQLAGYQTQVVAKALEDFFALTGGELRRTMGPLFDQLADDPATDPNLRATLKFVGSGKGQLATMLGQNIVGAAVGTGIGALLNNLLQPAVGRAIAGNPHLPVSVSDAVQARMRGMQGGVDARFDVLQQGIDDNRQDMLIELARPRHSPTEWLDLVNRGEVSEEFARINLVHLGYDPATAQRMLDLRRLLHTPASLADLVTFGVLSEDQAAPKAAQAGMSTEDFHLLVLGNGQPPSTTDLLEAYRRHIIDKPRLERGITQGPVRNEWFDMIEALRYSPMSTADAIEAAVQGHITQAQSREITDQNGLLPAHWQALYDTAGNPPGVQQMIGMWHRGVLTRDELVQGIKESRLKNKYIEPVIAAGETLPPERTIVSLVAKGDLTVARGMDLLLKHGFARDIAEALLSSAHGEKATTVRELTANQVITLYEDGGVSKQDATTMLLHLRYDADSAAQLLHLADVRAARKLQDAAVARIHAGFLAGSLDDNTASADLDALRVPTDQRESLLALWTLERAIPRHHLTEAQLRAAAGKQLITWDDYASELVAQGYAERDAALLVALHRPATAA